MLDQLTDEELEHLKETLCAKRLTSMRKALVTKTLQTAVAFNRWLNQNGAGITYSTFCNDFGYIPEAGENRPDTYKIVVKLIQMANNQTPAPKLSMETVLNPPPETYDPTGMLTAVQGRFVQLFYFYGHTPRKQGKVDKSCLSQWFPVSFAVDHITYPTAEHFMMAEKARLFNDDEMCQKILGAPSPRAAKQLGRRVRNFDETLWEKHRFGIVVRGNLAKFSQNAALKAFLLSTAPCVLVEASPYDKVWGIGLVEKHPSAKNPNYWQGLNLLGFALTEVRSQLA